METCLYTGTELCVEGDRVDKECTIGRMTLVTAKTLNYARNDISETPVIDYELHHDSSRAYKLLTTLTENVQPIVPHIAGLQYIQP